jgi:ribose 5-phosphate isomerase RpiB
MSEQMSVDKLVGMIRTAVFKSQTQADMNAAWDDAEALILSDRKATVGRCKKIIMEYADYDLAMLNDLDAVLEEWK